MDNINIAFPFQDSTRGFYIKLNTDDKSAIKSDLMHLILTNKGERLYLPDFGTNLRKHLFDQFDEITEAEIKAEIVDAVKKYIPNLQVTGVTITDSEETQYGVTVRIDYVVTDDVFETKEFIIINL